MISAARQKLRDIAEAAKAVKRLRDTGILDLGNLSTTLQAAKNAGVYGPQASLAIQGGRKFATLPALVDERGTLTYKQVDDQSTAFARGLNSLGIDEGSAVGLLCRDHRGLILAMAACGKLGAPFVLMNTGFAKPQFADVCTRENVNSTSRQRVLGPPRRVARRSASSALMGGRVNRPARRCADDRRRHRGEFLRAAART